MLPVMLGILAALVPNSVVVDADSEPPVDTERTRVAFMTCVAEPDERIQRIDVRTVGSTGAWYTADANHNVVVLGEDDPARHVHVQTVRLGSLPDVWIGVRITAVPAPLAAHIGEDGVMIANVVEGSPADRAGLQQYDVIVGFDDAEIVEPRGLTAAIGEIEAGDEATLSIVRQAEPLELDIVPSAPPTDPAEMEMKYEEPADSFFDAGVKMRGKALKIGPDGNYILEDLGDLHNLPDMLKGLDRLHDIDLDIDLDFGADDAHIFRFKLGDEKDMKVLKRMKIGPGFIWHGDHDEGEHAEITFEVQLEEDGDALKIRAEGDGVIHVTRIDEDGTETTTTYESVEELEEADPEAFEIYEPHTHGHTGHLLHVRPFGDRALKLRTQFQIDVHDRMKKALEQFEVAREGAMLKHEDAMKSAHEALKRAMQDKKRRSAEKLRTMLDVHSDADGAETRHTMLSVRTDDSGRITVKVKEDGELTKHEFSSKEAFQAAEPELYDQVKELLE